MKFKIFLSMTFLLTNFSFLKAMEEQDKIEGLATPKGNFEILPHQITTAIVDLSQNQSNMRLCSSYFSKFPYNMPLTLPKTFSNVGGKFIPIDRVTIPYGTLNLYYISDKALGDLGLTHSDSEADISSPAIERFLNSGSDQGQVLVLRKGIKLLDSTKALIDAKGFQIEYLPYTDKSEDLFNRIHLGDRYLRLLVKLYTETHRLDGYRFNLGDYCSGGEWKGTIPDNNRLINMLNVYDSLTKTQNGDVLVERLQTKQDLRIALKLMSDNPDLMAKFERICTSNLCTVESLLRIASSLGDIRVLENITLGCVDALRAFIPNYEERHYEEGGLTRSALWEHIVSTDDRDGDGIDRELMFKDFLESLVDFKDDNQELLLTRLFSLLKIDHIQQIIRKKDSAGAFPRQLKIALNIVQNRIIPLSENNFSSFLSYLKTNQIDINPLEDEAEKMISEVMEKAKLEGFLTY